MNNHAELNQVDLQIAELQRKKQELLAGMRKEALGQARELVRRFGFTAAELGLPAGSQKMAKTSIMAARYAHPANPDQTWHGGKGPRPKWVREYLEQGGQLSDLEIR